MFLFTDEIVKFFTLSSENYIRLHFVIALCARKIVLRAKHSFGDQFARPIQGLKEIRSHDLQCFIQLSNLINWELVVEERSLFTEIESLQKN